MYYAVCIWIHVIIANFLFHQMEPIKGGNEEGAVGVLKGTAKGIGGYGH